MNNTRRLHTLRRCCSRQLSRWPLLGPRGRQPKRGQGKRADRSAPLRRAGGRKGDRLQATGRLRLAARRCRSWRSCWPTNSLPRGRGSRWKRFRVRRPTKRCARRLDSLKGRLLVGTINSIGVRRDAGAVDPLTGALEGPGCRRRVGRGRCLGAHRKCRRDQDAAQIAGRRPGQSPRGGRRGLHPVRRATDGRRQDERSGRDLRRSPQGRCSQAEDPRSDARSDSRPQVGRHSALDRATPLAGQGLVSDRLEHGPRACRTRSRRCPGGRGGRARRRSERLCCSWPWPTATMPVVPPAVLEAAKSGPKQVRIAAIGVVGRLGDASSLPTLLEIAADSRRGTGASGQDGAGRPAGRESQRGDRRAPAQGRRQDARRF